MRPEIALDHLVVTAQTLGEGTEYIESALGVRLSNVGHHAHMGTHNRLLSLGPDVYFEVIAIDPEAEAPPYPRWFNLDAFEGLPKLTHWACRTNDLGELLKIAPVGSGTATPLERGIFRWQFGVPETGKHPYDGAMPALIQWETKDHPAPLLDDVGVRLTAFDIEHPSASTFLDEFPVVKTLPNVSVQIGQTVGMRAVFDTPDGEKILE